ncbi:MAG: hypothetical protein ACK4YP_07955, partial [Myxococcota bacterium]
LHELAHAVAFLATGYTVAGFAVSLTDRAGRGHVRPGPAWTRFARPWLTNLVSPVAPAAAAVLALAALHAWSGAPGLVASFDGMRAALGAVPWGRWELWAGLTLGYSVTAEMAPSGIDLAAWWRPALVAAGLAGVLAFALERSAPGLVGAWVATLDASTRAPVAAALAMAAWSGLAVAPVAFVVGKLRGV